MQYKFKFFKNKKKDESINKFAAFKLMIQNNMSTNMIKFKCLEYLCHRIYNVDDIEVIDRNL